LDLLIDSSKNHHPADRSELDRQRTQEREPHSVDPHSDRPPPAKPCLSYPDPASTNLPVHIRGI